MRKLRSLTAGKLREMLTENTGRALCDSGDYYGRHWQRNKGRDFDAEPDACCAFGIWEHDGKQELEIMVTLNVFHWLLARVEYDPPMQRRFSKFAKRPDQAEEQWLAVMEAFINHLREQGHEVAGLYGAGEPMTVNTYNGEDSLSQTLQYLYFEVDGDGPFVLLQIHGGCDVRGGYTAPKAFRVADHDGTAIFDNARYSIYEECGQGWAWDSDDGCHPEPVEYYPATADLLEPGRNWRMSPRLEHLPLSTDESRIGDGIHLVVTEHRRAFTPNGGELRAAPWPAG